MGGKTISNSETKIEALKLQSSAYGVTIPLVYGVQRIAGNLLDYLGFKAVPHTETQGGKGGGVKVQNTSYSYQADVIMGLCHGPISDVPRIWRGKELYSGGVTPGQIQQASESYTVPGSGAMVYALGHAANYLAMVSITAQLYTQEGVGDSLWQGYRTVELAQGIDYTVSAGTLTVLNTGMRGQSLAIVYQWLSGSRPQAAADQLGLTWKLGAIGQAAWSALPAGRNVPYSGLAWVAGAAYDLGTGAQVENHLFEVVGPMAYHLGPTVPDVDPAQALRSILTQAQGGAGYPARLLGDWTAWSDHCCAAGLLVSPALEQQQTAADVLRLALELTNAAAVAADGLLKIVPLADAAEAGNGRTYTPNATPLYQLDDDCYTPADDGSPISITLKSAADRYNHWRVEFLNRANAYAVEIAEAKDQADIDAFGLRTAPTVQAHWICDAVVARKVAQIKLQRSLAVCAEYTVPLPEHYALIAPAELLTLTDTVLQMQDLPVRVTVIEEQDDGGMVYTCEDYPAGTASAATYPSQHGAGYGADYNAAPGNCDAPVIFEAPAMLTGTGLELYVAVRGSGASWGGAQVWVSFDGTNYRQMGTVYGGARYGTLSAGVSSGSAAMGVQGLGGAQLVAGSAADAAALATLCYVGGGAREYLAHQGATLTGAGAYTLGGLVRGAYATAAAAHSAGDPFVRVDDRVAKSGDLDAALVGKTVYVKVCSFNLFGGAVQSLADVSATAYTITGAMAALVPGWGGKGVKLRASALAFQLPKAGGVNPAAITLTAERKGTLQGAVTWAVTAGTVTLAGAGDTRTIDPATLTTDTATVRVSITDTVATYVDEVTLAKVREGADGGNGANGTNGIDGASLYTWVAYANAADGSAGFTTGAWAGQAYLGLASNKTSPVESADPADYSWVLMQGAQYGVNLRGVPPAMPPVYMTPNNSSPLATSSSVYLTLGSDGIASYLTGNIVREFRWCEGTPTGSYAVRLSVRGGATPTTGAVDTDLSLSSNRTWTWVQTGTGRQDFTGEYLIIDTSAGVVRGGGVLSGYVAVGSGGAA